MKGKAKATLNIQAVAPREATPAYQVYLLAPDYIKSNGDIYGKGASVLHTLRYLIGDDAFFRSLRRMSYPRKEMEGWTDGRQTRLVNTDDFLTIAEEESKMELDWFFEIYLRQPKLPKLVTELVPAADSPTQKALVLSWETPNNMPFPMPVDVVVNGKTQRVVIKDGRVNLPFTGAEPSVDPNGWVLKEK
jgi:aminopeptidase N